MEEKVDLCIVYDEFTKKQAKALYHKLSEKLIRCVCHDEKTYLHDEKGNTNFNKVLFFSKTLIKENLAKEISTTQELVQGVDLLSNGCAYGIVVDPSVIVEKSFWGRNWWKYLITLVASGLIGAAVLSTFLLINDPRKKAEIKLYFDAVQYLIKDDNITIILPKQLDF